jgi:hypothetical protein
MDWLRHPLRRDRAAYHRVRRFAALPDVPEELRAGTVALVGTRRNLKWAAFDCPCDRRHRIVLPLGAAEPRWTVTRRWRRATIRPSIDSNDGQRCHYFITRGEVRWL